MSDTPAIVEPPPMVSPVPPPLLGGWPTYAGLLLLAGLWLGPLTPMSRYAFSAHMVLHLGVAVVAAPLIAIGIGRSSFAPAQPRHPWRAGLLAALFEMAVVWGWHVPKPYAAAAENDGLFWIQQASFLAAGLVVWLTAFSGKTRLHFGIGALIMLMTFMHMTMLGAVLAVVPNLIYAPGLCVGVLGITGVENQHLGGALMAVGGGLPYLIGGTVLAYRAVAD